MEGNEKVEQTKAEPSSGWRPNFTLASRSNASTAGSAGTGDQDIADDLFGNAVLWFRI